MSRAAAEVGWDVGARDFTTGKQVNDAFAVLLPPGKPPESARKVAAQFYTQRGLQAAELLGERTEKVENSQRFNPENGALLTEPVTPGAESCTSK